MEHPGLIRAGFHNLWMDIQCGGGGRLACRSRFSANWVSCPHPRQEQPGLQMKISHFKFMEDFCVMKPDKGAPLGTPSMNLKFNEEYCSVIYIILTLV